MKIRSIRVHPRPIPIHNDPQTVEEGNVRVNIALIQGLYFLITGIWPLLSIRTFMAVTGPKVDLWLVKTVGLLLAVIGAGLIVASGEESLATSTIVIAVGSAAAMAIIDVVYVAKRVIRKIYLADAAVEIALIAWWLIGTTAG